LFTKALLRRPGKNFADGITSSGLGKPDFGKALGQHQAYCDALEFCGLEIIVLDSDERFPDGCFVEDTAIVVREAAIITRPGAASRLGEETSVSAVLSNYKKIEQISYPGRVDGGDILRAENHFYIGRSKRTNRAGASQLTEILEHYGYTSSEIMVESVPHLKSGTAYIGNGTFISIDEFSNEFPGSNVIRIDKDEAYASNCLPVNDFLLISRGFPKARRKIVGSGQKIIELEMSEFRKMDGALTCLSLLF